MNRPGYIAVDELLPRVTVEQAAAFYNFALPPLHRVGSEVRSACFLACGHQGGGDRCLAINAGEAAKTWKCHVYGCDAAGNLLDLMFRMKHGHPPSGGKLRGDEFKEIARDLQALVTGERSDAAPAAARQPPPVAAAKPETPKVNVPLKDSENERARPLVTLDDKFIIDLAAMSPAAAAYVRKRPYLTAEVLKQWRTGYLPRPGNAPERAGGTMQGKIVYPMIDETGDVLTWFGRDPEWEEKHAKWTRAGKSAAEPTKFHFVKGYHRGLELFGQHRIAGADAESLHALGLVVVEGPNDVISAACNGVTAVGLCSNQVTDEQVAKIARLATAHASGRAIVMLDCDPEGEKGAQKAAWVLAQHCDVRVAWSEASHAGAFRGRQPESLNADEWRTIRAALDRR